VFQAGTILFALASVLGGLSQSPAAMVTARVLQGIGAAVAAPSILALFTVMAKDEAARNRGLALFTAASAVGSSFGLILGGLLTSLASWRWALFINLPVGIAVVVTVHLLLAETPRSRGGFDVLGALSATGGSLALVYGFIHAAESTWTSPWTILSFVLAAALLGLFAVNEHRARDPLLKPALLRDRTRSGALSIMALVVGAHFAMLFMLVQYYQRVKVAMPQLSDKVALVTGGTAGIGLAIARHFIEEGAFVYITGRRQKELDAAVDSLGDQAAGVQGDVADPENAAQLIDIVAQRHGRLDVVVVNAGG
jgi:MFS family permease